ncbi:hypothetical protein BpHYR1_027714, partial [Brachionus plicatilis]
NLEQQKTKQTLSENSNSKSSDRSLQSITEIPEATIVTKSFQRKHKLPPLSSSHRKISRRYSISDDSIGDSLKDELSFDESGTKKSETPYDDVTDFIEEEDETFEEHLQNVIKKNTRSFTPLSESIWPQELLNTRTNNENNDIYNKIGFKFGSNLSEDGKYALLKTYEDMIYYELLSINPDKNLNKSLERTKTEFFKSLPKKEELKLPEIKNKHMSDIKENNKSLMSELNKKKYSCTKQLEKAMKIYDGIKKFKGEHTTNQNYYKKNQLLAAYKSWKSNCYFNL